MYKHENPNPYPMAQVPQQNNPYDFHQQSMPVSQAANVPGHVLPQHTGHAHMMAGGVPPPVHQPLSDYCGEKNGWKYQLRVEQQPVRARMCGFGDKDRRPITPPPCIRLIITDAATGKEVDPSEVDSTFFVLSVDLWNNDGTQEVNLVRHSSNSPAVSISTASTTSYPPPPERPAIMTLMHHTDQYGAYNGVSHMHPYASQGMYQFGHGAVPPYAHLPHLPIAPTTPASGMFTRNLIGSLSVNAFKLKDTENKEGFWFVLQDLSVRTEGSFRLKMNFVDVGNGDGTTLNQGKAPVLATTYSDQFTVYSAKKFPGVIESTALSKAFAQQGIKIPIRKDGPKPMSNAHEYDADEQ